MSGVLICSDRAAVCEELVREFERLSASPMTASRREEWPEEAPSLVVVDLDPGSPPVREACLAWSGETELWALADSGSADRLVPALAAGCADYLFFPVNPDELRLRWRKHLEGRGSRVEPGGELEGRLELEFPSRVRHLRPIVEEVVDSCETLAVGGSRAHLNLKVALGEAISNAILYGNGEDPEKRVRVAAEYGEEAVVVTVTDEGEGFDPSAVADPTRPENRDRPHGRGLFLLRTLMDRVEWNERGNRVTLVLRL